MNKEETKEAMKELDILAKKTAKLQEENVRLSGTDITARVCQMMNKCAALEEENKKLRKEVEILQQTIRSLREAASSALEENQIN